MYTIILGERAQVQDWIRGGGIVAQTCCCLRGNAVNIYRVSEEDAGWKPSMEVVASKVVTFLASDRLVARSSGHQTINLLLASGHHEHILGVGLVARERMRQASSRHQQGIIR
jgi:hypothetical protein